MKIKNFEKLALSEERKAALAIVEAGLEAIDTKKIVKESCLVSEDNLIIKGETISLGATKRIFVVGVGKCSLDACTVLENVLGDRLSGGIVLDVRGGNLKKIKSYQGTHPLPSEANIKATHEIISLLKKCEKRDLVIFVISGGGSTLLCQPTSFTWEEEVKFFHHLTNAGATIREMNMLRKHISLARGGYLAKYTYPAKSVVLIFSDAPGNDFGVISSGPTVKDITSITDAENIVKKYKLSDLYDFSAGTIIETPKEDKYFENVKNILVVSNHTALEAMAEKAKDIKFTPRIITTTLSGEAREVGKKIIEELSGSHKKEVLLYGGETTVTIKNTGGKGGRNQELVLAALPFLRTDQILISVASDGRDNGEFGGAICDIITSEKAKSLGLLQQDFLDKHLSYDFFEATESHLDLGDTGSNVSDLIIALND